MPRVGLIRVIFFFLHRFIDASSFQIVYNEAFIQFDVFESAYKREIMYREILSIYILLYTVVMKAHQSCMYNNTV